MWVAASGEQRVERTLTGPVLDVCRTNAESMELVPWPSGSGGVCLKNGGVS